MILTYTLLAIYILALLYIGLKDHKNEDKDGFIIADRKVGIIGTISSISAGFRTGGGLFVLLGGGFAFGYGLYNLLFGIIIGAFLLGRIAPKARQVAKDKNYITINQMVRDYIGIKTEKVSSFIVLVFAVLGVSAQFFVLGKVASMLLGINPLNGILVSALVVSVYVSLGGYKSIIKTDILQFAIMVALWLVVFMIPLNKETVLDVSTVYTFTTPLEFWSGVVYGVLLVFAYSDFWQRIFSSRDDKVAKKSMNLIALSWLAMSLPLTLIGMSARGIIPSDTGFNDVFMAIINSKAYTPMFISMITLGAISITMSTLDTYSYVFSSTLLENFMQASIKHSKKKYIYVKNYNGCYVICRSILSIKYRKYSSLLI